MWQITMKGIGEIGDWQGGNFNGKIFAGFCSGRSAGLDWTGWPKGSPRCPTCGNFFRWMESLQIWFDVMEPHWIYLHPWKWTAGSQKITQSKSGKSFEPNLHGFGFLNVIFQGCRFKMDISMDPCELGHSGLLPEQSRLVRESWRGDD